MISSHLLKKSFMENFIFCAVDILVTLLLTLNRFHTPEIYKKFYCVYYKAEQITFQRSCNLCSYKLI